MPLQDKGDPITSPWVLQFSNETGVVSVSVEFNESMPNWPLTGITVTRPVGCDMGVLVLNRFHKFPCAEGDTFLTMEQLQANTFVLFADITSYAMEQV